MTSGHRVAGTNAAPPVAAGLLASVLAVSAGGVVGSLGRWLVSLALPQPAGGFPWGTFCVNVTGAFLAGLAITLILARPGVSPLLRPFLVVGVLGGWTTFSAYVLDAHTLLTQDRPALALGYVAASLLVGLLAVAAGASLARRSSRGRA